MKKGGCGKSSVYVRPTMLRVFDTVFPFRRSIRTRESDVRRFYGRYEIPIFLIDGKLGLDRFYLMEMQLRSSNFVTLNCTCVLIIQRDDGKDGSFHCTRLSSRSFRMRFSGNILRSTIGQPSRHYD